MVDCSKCRRGTILFVRERVNNTEQTFKGSGLVRCNRTGMNRVSKDKKKVCVSFEPRR